MRGASACPACPTTARGRPTSSAAAATPRTPSSGPTTRSGAPSRRPPCSSTMWDKLDTNKKIGVMWPNDADGNAWADPKTGMPTFCEPGRLHVRRPRPVPERHRGLHVADLQVQGRRRRDPQRRHDPAGLHQLLEAGVPAGLQARRSSRWPRPCSSRRPSRPSATSATASPPRCGGRRSTRTSRRSPARPASRSPTPTSRRTGKQWTQPIMHYAVFEVVADAIKRTENIDDKEIHHRARSRPPTSRPSAAPCPGAAATNNPVKNVSITPLVGGQWVPGREVPVRPQDRRQLDRAGHPDQRRAHSRWSTERD